MRRRRLEIADANHQGPFREGELIADLPTELGEYVEKLRLLSDVPFSYLLADISQLPPESVRFFFLDVNWLEALTDGALSIGRVCLADSEFDRAVSPHIISQCDRNCHRPRLSIMHSNHKKGGVNFLTGSASGAPTGYIMRSELVRRLKGLETEGYNGDTRLNILRFDTLTEDIIICIFDGELTRFVIAEPKTGLRFGYSDSTGRIVLKSAAADENFGAPLEDKLVNIRDAASKFVNEKGRINAAKLTRKFGELLNVPADASLFAFEMISVAHRVEFLRGGNK